MFRILQRKKSDDISLSLWLIILHGQVWWIYYDIVKNSISLRISNGVGILLNSFIILLFSDTELVFGTDINWFAYSFISMAGFAAIALIVKQLTRLDINPDVINFYIFLFTTAGFYPFIYFSDLSFSVPPKSLLFFLLFMLVAVITNHCSVIALKTAPNPGYVLAVRSFNSVLVSVVAIFLFKSEISVRKFIGIIFSVVGLILLAL